MVTNPTAEWSSRDMQPGKVLFREAHSLQLFRMKETNKASFQELALDQHHGKNAPPEKSIWLGIFSSINHYPQASAI
jgi:hypothetical protein